MAVSDIGTQGGEHDGRAPGPLLQSSQRGTGPGRRSDLSLYTALQVWQLYNKYRMDFTMFEYEIDPKYLIRYYDKTNTK